MLLNKEKRPNYSSFLATATYCVQQHSTGPSGMSSCPLGKGKKTQLAWKMWARADLVEGG